MDRRARGVLRASKLGARLRHLVRLAGRRHPRVESRRVEQDGPVHHLRRGGRVLRSPRAADAAAVARAGTVDGGDDQRDLSRRRQPPQRSVRSRHARADADRLAVDARRLGQLAGVRSHVADPLPRGAIRPPSPRSDRNQHHAVAACRRRRPHHRVRLQDAERVAPDRACPTPTRSSPTTSFDTTTKSRCRRRTRRCRVRNTACARTGAAVRAPCERPVERRRGRVSDRVPERRTGGGRLPGPIGRRRRRATDLHRRTAQARERRMERSIDRTLGVRLVGARAERVLPRIQRAICPGAVARTSTCASSTTERIWPSRSKSANRGSRDAKVSIANACTSRRTDFDLSATARWKRGGGR